MFLVEAPHASCHAADLGLTLPEIQKMLAASQVVRRRLGASVYAYTTPAGYRVVVDTCTRTVLNIGYALDADALNGWGFTPHAIEDCKRLATTPAAVVDSMDDAQPYPAAYMRTLYRGGFYDVLVDESKRLVVSIEPAGTVASTDHQGTPRFSGGSPVGSMPASITELLDRVRKAGCAVSITGSGHYKIWGSGVVGQGCSVTVPATGSDYRGLRNAVMQVRSVVGVDVRLI